MRFNKKTNLIIARIKKVMRNNPPQFNEKEVIKAMQNHYDLLGVKMPKITIETDLVKAFDAARGAARGAAWDAARDAAWDAARDTARGAARDAAWGAARDVAWDTAWGAARDAAWGAARDVAWGAAWDVAWGAAWGAARDAARGAARDTAWGAARDTAWGAARDVAATATGLRDEKTLKYIKIEAEILKALENGLGWYFPMKDNLILVPFPKVTVDKDQRLHNEKEPAVDWKSGAKFYFYHGVKVTEKIILKPNRLTKKDWSSEKNTEVRRVIQERMGTDFPKKIGCKLIDKPSKEFKKHNLLGLYEVKLKADPDKVAHYIRVRDHSTKRIFYLRTPSTMNSADESLSWTFNKKVKEYNPIIET